MFHTPNISRLTPPPPSTTVSPPPPLPLFRPFKSPRSPANWSKSPQVMINVKIFSSTGIGAVPWRGKVLARRWKSKEYIHLLTFLNVTSNVPWLFRKSCSIPAGRWRPDPVRNWGPPAGNVPRCLGHLLVLSGWKLDCCIEGHLLDNSISLRPFLSPLPLPTSQHRFLHLSFLSFLSFTSSIRFHALFYNLNFTRY